MAYANLYVELEISPETGYILAKECFYENQLEDQHNNSIETFKSYGSVEKCETLEGFKNQFIFLEKVKFDGRKGVNERNILASLEEKGLAKMVSISNIFPYYSSTDQLKDLLAAQLQHRKELIAKGQFVNLKETA